MFLFTFPPVWWIHWFPARVKNGLIFHGNALPVHWVFVFQRFCPKGLFSIYRSTWRFCFALALFSGEGRSSWLSVNYVACKYRRPRLVWEHVCHVKRPMQALPLLSGHWSSHNFIDTTGEATTPASRSRLQCSSFLFKSKFTRLLSMCMVPQEWAHIAITKDCMGETFQKNSPVTIESPFIRNEFRNIVMRY